MQRLSPEARFRGEVSAEVNVWRLGELTADGFCMLSITSTGIYALAGSSFRPSWPIEVVGKTQTPFRTSHRVAIAPRKMERRRHHVRWTRSKSLEKQLPTDLPEKADRPLSGAAFARSAGSAESRLPG